MSKSWHEYEEKNLILADLIRKMDHKQRVVVIDQEGEVFEGRCEDLMHTASGDPHCLCDHKVKWFEALVDASIAIYTEEA